MKVCAGIVLFHPETDRLKQNIDAVLTQADKLILVNNAPEDADRLLEFLPAGSFVWINNDKNLGIAAALNQLLTYADKNGYKWVLTLDQDSICCDNLVNKLLAAGSENNNIAMVSPRVFENGIAWEDPVYARTLAKQQRSSGKIPASDVEDVPFCITSGTLTNVEAALSTGGFDERLFIDEVDRDMCIRLRYNGYRILRVNTAEMHHEFGSELVHRRLLFRVYKYRNYSPFRVYYQMRNLVYMVRKYGADYKPYPVWRLVRPFFTFFIKFIFEPERLSRLKAFFKGYAAGWVMKL